MGIPAKKMTLTPQQQAVVSDRGGDLLVAAAAGSGKTKVLVDRIMSRICEDKADITDFVVITYTKAAAAELRAKIMAELSSRLAYTPGDKHLQKQMSLVYAANISTVHAFCANLLRSYAAVAGIPSDFRVGEEQECRLLRATAMEDMLEALYKNIERRPDTKAFIEELAYGRDDSAVPAILHNIYDTVQSHPWPAKWVAQCLDNMNVSRYVDAAESPWGAYIMDSTKSSIRSQLQLIDAAQAICDGDPVLAEAFNPALATDRNKLNVFLCCETWDELRMAVEDKANKWGRQKALRKGVPYSEVLKARITDLRTRYKKNVEGKLKGIYGFSTEVLDDLRKTEAPIRGMFELMADFAERYQAKKEAHNLLDFSDLEHETIRLLLNEETEERSELAVALAGQYKEIFVDEYQDTNEVQETIFNAISSQNRSMVGDVKQSIYMFRLADPSIFLRHYNTFKPHTKAGEGEARKILLTQNFRSRPEILSATNDVMRMCMSPTVGGVDYDDNEALIPGRTDFIPLPDPLVELAAINMDVQSSDPLGEDDAVEAVAKADVEARYVAGRIKNMIGAETIMDEKTGELRPIKAGDIAILMRSTKNSAKHYVKALAEHGIACSAAKGGSILDTTEVATLYAYMQVIDNPTQDIPLVAVMASPLVGFTAEKLACVRMAKKDSRTYYDALLTYHQENEEDEISSLFLKQLRYLRREAPHIKLSQLFDDIVSLTDADDVFGSMSNGNLRMSNVQKFRELIVSYENSGAHGLFAFICHIEALRKQGEELPQAAAVVAEDAVSILSIHSSKGLEYPVVFLSDLSRRFNSSDLKSSALLHKDLGAGVQVMDRRLMYRYPTIARTAISSAIAAESKSEELRILYVAMTRAKQKLIMTYCDKLGRTVSRLAAEVTSPLPPHVSQSVSNPGEWVLLTALMRPEGAPLAAIGGCLPLAGSTETAPWHIVCINAKDIGGETLTMEALESAMSEEDTDAEAILRAAPPCGTLDLDQIKKDMAFVYPHTNATKTPAKAVASALFKQAKVTIKRPDFAKKGKFTAAERGTATHTFMRYANYSQCVAGGIGGIKAEIKRMVAQKFIAEQDAQAIITPALETLFASEVGAELALFQPECVKREYPFTLLVPANTVLGKDAPEDNIVIQGIVDLHAVTEEGIVLYDFKTDYVEDEVAEQEKASSYKEQMAMYAMALETIYHKPVIRREIIFLRTGHKIGA